MKELESLESKDWVNDELADSIALITLLYPVPDFEKWIINLSKKLKRKEKCREVHAELQRLINEESRHLSAHYQMNSIFDERYNTKVLSMLVRWIMNIINLLPMGFQLWLAVINENLVAAASKDILERHKLFNGIPKRWMDTLIWHSQEEILHKDVLYNAATSCGYSRKWLYLAVPFIVFGSMIGFYISFCSLGLSNLIGKSSSTFWHRHFLIFWSNEHGLFRKHTRTVFSMLKPNWSPNGITSQ